MSAVLDDPCKDVTNHLKMESETLVHLICQKSADTERPKADYLIESCPIIVKREPGFTGKINPMGIADIPQLNSILLSNLTQVCILFPRTEKTHFYDLDKIRITTKKK